MLHIHLTYMIYISFTILLFSLLERQREKKVFKMFKTKLQEVCHQRNLGLPRYSCVKHGLEHNPCFRASVFVDGVSYDSTTVSKSAKKALNHAARLAFFHLTTGVEPSDEVPETDKAYTSPHSNPSSSDVKVDFRTVIGKHHQHKLQLQQFAQSKNLDPPLYSCKREGPPHALQFQASVTIGGQSFESQDYYRNLKEAQNAAAKEALLSLGVLQETDTRSYKSLLQSLAQNRGLIFYKTLTYGPPHQPMFFSTVEIEGEIFDGEGGKSKKLAEISAAKAAYLLLMKRELTGDFELASIGFSSEVPTKSSPCPGPLTNLNSQKISKAASSVGSSPTEGSVGYAIENEDDFQTKSSVNAKTSYISSSPKEGQSNTATVAPPDLSSLTITSSKTKKVEMGNYLLCNKVRVYTSIPSTKFPEGTVLLPIDNHKWVAVSLEFPNQKVN